MRCERCQEREATCHTTTIVDGVKTSSHLCADCFEESAFLESREAAAATRAAHCRYCGGQPCTGGTDLLAMITGEPRMMFMCVSCSTEFYRFMQEQAQRIPQGSSRQEQLAAIPALQDEVDRHMKQWVSRSGSP
jgi:protein-arginine kinase activator protein McsA